MSRQRDRQEHAGHTYEDQMLSDDYDPEYAEEMNRSKKESHIRRELKRRVEAYGGEVRAVSWLGRSNAPDVLCLFPQGCLYLRQRAGWTEVFGHPFVETKRPGKDATEAQAREHERMRAAGCDVLVITTQAELDAWLPPL